MNRGLAPAHASTHQCRCAEETIAACSGSDISRLHDATPKESKVCQFFLACGAFTLVHRKGARDGPRPLQVHAGLILPTLVSEAGR
jgi:hypothetical protein